MVKKRIKKGDASKAKKGAAKNYITRTQAVRRLQISLPDFRRLCIFKGIYPREPRNKRKVQKGATPSTTFYYTKDIQYLQHEPLLSKFRDHNALAKKIGRALGRNEVSDAARLEKNKPRMTLDHLVKERYPSFVDALRDLDDALSMLFLFASLPSTTHVSSKTITLCQRLCLEFQHYVIVSRSLRKSFLSIKGIYYQATIQGQDIMWLVPYKFVQTMSGDVDFRIMGTFIEFYTTLMGFVNYRLYTTVGLVYPPKFDSVSDSKGGELGAFTLEGKAIQELNRPESFANGVQTSAPASSAVQAEADKLLQIQNENDDHVMEEKDEENTTIEIIDSFQPVTTTDADVLLQPEAKDGNSNTLFSKHTFFLSRETPKAALEFILKSFGCSKVGWDAVLGDGAFTVDEQDPRITHQVVDKPPLAPPEFDSDDEEQHNALIKPTQIPGRIYVQPQWIWDSINQNRLAISKLYAPGVVPPPHLSPWVRTTQGVYDPTISLAEQEKPDEAELNEDDEDQDDDEAGDSDGVSVSDELGMIIDTGDTNLENMEELESDDVVDQEDDDAEDDAYQKELEAEAAGQPLKQGPKKSKAEVARQRKALKDKKAQEDLDRQRMMMPNKKRKLFDKMQYGNKKRDAEAEKLRQKRRKIEKKLGARATA